MNKAMFTGRLTTAPELKQTQNGVAVCSFTLAVKRPRVKDKTDFINFVAWRNNAEFLTRFFKKGDAVEVSGALTSRKYQDNNGNNRVAFEVECDDIAFPLTAQKAEQAQQPAIPAYSDAGAELEELNADDELPF